MRRRRHETTKRGRTDDRAVTDMIAFILVFATIIGSVALLSTVGFQTMADYQDGEKLRNAERAMESLAVNFNAVMRHDGIDRRYGELALRDGSVSTGSGGTNVTILLNGNSSNVSANPIELGAFTYEAGSDTIAYEGGGVVRAGETGSAVVKRPQLMCHPEAETAVISLTAINATDRSIRSTDGLGFTMTERDRETQFEDGVTNVSIRMNTSYVRAWEMSFERSGWETTKSTSSDLLATCEDDPDNPVNSVAITVVEADVEY
ncbi:DUF7289 family protein [Natrinema halophilum]|uniref:Uncharacterized protein n=1 Tax=Natrinema halophilum TaxID=1699371 RepID=A0A7D5KF31_9EURY|nr:hypothetical protein [Natrinema halophilum]QLG50541.1 hypothetical protein HYG82_17670 [Natrinema halophilum]